MWTRSILCAAFSEWILQKRSTTCTRVWTKGIRRSPRTSATAPSKAFLRKFRSSKPKRRLGFTRYCNLFVCWHLLDIYLFILFLFYFGFDPLSNLHLFCCSCEKLRSHSKSCGTWWILPTKREGVLKKRRAFKGFPKKTSSGIVYYHWRQSSRFDDCSSNLNKKD